MTPCRRPQIDAAASLRLGVAVCRNCQCLLGAIQYDSNGASMVWFRHRDVPASVPVDAH